MLPCRHLNADEFQFVANGSDIEIGNFLQDGAGSLFPLLCRQACRQPQTVDMPPCALLQGLHQDTMGSVEQKLQPLCNNSLPIDSMQLIIVQHRRTPHNTIAARMAFSCMCGCSALDPTFSLQLWRQMKCTCRHPGSQHLPGWRCGALPTGRSALSQKHRRHARGCAGHF